MENTLDGITGPNGECVCDHCQLDHNIDGITKNEINHIEIEEDQTNDQTIIPVVQQLAS